MKKNFWKVLVVSGLMLVGLSSCEHFALHLNHMHSCGGGYRVVHHRPVVHHHHGGGHFHAPHHRHR